MKLTREEIELICQRGINLEDIDNEYDFQAMLPELCNLALAAIGGERVWVCVRPNGKAATAFIYDNKTEALKRVDGEAQKNGWTVRPYRLIPMESDE